MSLPVSPKIGGNKGTLKLKSDMAGVGSGKSKPKIVGGLKKNPGKASSRKRA